MDKNIHANPVEITNKDIYLIRNKTNGKEYIGQSLDAKERFREHCKPSSAESSLIAKAIQKYGKDNFELKILEEQIPNYNERERYWIEKYNSTIPNGYNILEGGEEPPTLFGEDSPMCKITDKDIILLKKDLINTKASFGELANKYSISKRQVMRINAGESRFDKTEDYPLRKESNPCGKLTESDVDEIIYLLKESYILNGTIGRMFGVDPHAINKINKGETHHRQNEKYPIRKWKSSGVILFTYSQVTEIIDLLTNTSLSMNKIAKMYDVYVQSIMIINNGSSKKYRRDGIKYPIRKYS